MTNPFPSQPVTRDEFNEFIGVIVHDFKVIESRIRTLVGVIACLFIIIMALVWKALA